jgi:hypothetical protein
MKGFIVLWWEGKENSPHEIAMKYCEDLMNQSKDIHNLINKQALKNIENNCLRLKSIIDTIWRWTFQSYPFRGHNESRDSKNQGYFIELLKLLVRK